MSANEFFIGRKKEVTPIRIYYIALSKKNDLKFCLN